MPCLATSDGTHAFGARHVGARRPETTFRSLGRTGLLVSAVGFGCHRVDERPQHAEALAHALRSGCNLFDVPPSADGVSERAVGRVLAETFESEGARRSEVVVVSKVGYVRGEFLELVRERERAGNPSAGFVRHTEDCWHGIHPDIVHEQVTRSLERLGLSSLDVCLLHDPESFLTDASQRGGSPDEAREELDRRIHDAFAALEEEVDAGRIGAYGVSSSTFVSPARDADATSVSRVVDIARDVAREERGDPDSHHLAVIQLPFNLLEAGAFLERNTGADSAATALDAAMAGGLAVLANRPLDALRDGRLVRLSEFPLRGCGVDAASAARRVHQLEEEYRERIAPALEGEDLAPADRFFAWGAELGASAGRFSGVEHWRQVEEEFIRPRLAHLLSHVSLHLVGKVRNDWAAWKDRYAPAIEDLLAAVGDRYRSPAQRESADLTSRLDPHLPAAMRRETLSRKAIACLAWTPGVTSVLTGMRRKDYVDDALGVLDLPKVAATEALFRAL